jgi:hypothetical protein
MYNLINFFNSNSGQKFDYILRLTNDAKAGNYKVVYAETGTIAYPLAKIILENRNLKFILQNQWRAYNYYLEYNNYLLGNYSKEDFLVIARRYAQPFLRLTDNQILELTSVILETIEGTLNSDEISQLINVDPGDIEKVLNKYSQNKMAEVSEE